MPSKIIGIAGTNGSGKDTVGHILEKDHGYLFVSVTDILREELKKQNLSPSRENMRALSSSLRKQYGLGVLVDKAIELFDLSNNKYSGLAMASLRNPGEADSVHRAGGTVIWLDADPQIRYRRITASDGNRGVDRDIDDKKTFEEFMADEETEMHHSSGGDLTTLSMADVKSKSDLILYNNDNNLEVLSLKLNAMLGFKF